MKFCIKCGAQMDDDMNFCQKCGTKVLSGEDISSVQTDTQQSFTQVNDTSANFEQSKITNPKLRTSMKVWMIIFFVLTGIFAIGCMSDISMLAGVFLFGILGVMFLCLAKTPKESTKLFADIECFKKTQGISKGAFVGISIFLAFFLFVGIINAFDTNTANVNEIESTNTTTAINTEEKKQAEKEAKIPAEFADECPVSISVSMYDNIINFPELSCNIKNKTDKEISAIQLYFVPKDVYGEEINGVFAQNKLQCDTPISANGTYTPVWQMIDKTIKSGNLYVYSVYFADGTEWGDRNAPASTIKQYALKMQVTY